MDPDFGKMSVFMFDLKKMDDIIENPHLGRDFGQKCKKKPLIGFLISGRVDRARTIFFWKIYVAGKPWDDFGANWKSGKCPLLF